LEPSAGCSNSSVDANWGRGDKDRRCHFRQTIAFSITANSTLNLTFDGYYDYNFNHPIGRVNSLRAYDVLSNSFSLNPAAAIFEFPTDVEAGRRYGLRLDLQFWAGYSNPPGKPAN
jgi:hypothetical protein